MDQDFSGERIVADSSAALSEDILERLAQASRVHSFNDALFDVRAGGDLFRRLHEVMAAVQAADPDALLRRQAARHAFLGADVEARMTFALARKQACASLVRADDAAIKTAGLLQLLEEAREGLVADDRRLADVWEAATSIARGLTVPQTPEAGELQARFNRRLINLQSVRASNALTLAQIPKAISQNRQILDRYNDVSTLLFPVWERHAVSLLQSPHDPAAIGAFRSAARLLIDRLADPADVAA